MTLSQAPGYDEDGETIGMTTNSDVSFHPPLNLTKKLPPTSESDQKLSPTSESDKKAPTHL